MLTFLFWNVNGKPLSDAIAAIAHDEAIDVLILAECGLEPAALLRALNREERAFHFAPGQSRRINIFSRFPGRYLRPAYESDRISIRRLALPVSEEVLLVAVHFPSKLHWSNESQTMECAVLSRTIADEERRAGHSRTVLVGDLNMNPFESGVVGASGLHAVMARKVAERVERTVQGVAYPFFSNPMWGHLGDWADRPPGSYYYERAEHVNYFWNTFDQVLVRPQLMERFRSDQVRLLSRAGATSLRTEDGRPNTVDGSDHFPLLFKLDL
ncbi:MAG: endonuclease/exonuclease/phosphatase family protein [Acidobacteriia bacterium]|nr:endonuclease/exonuclease/phosphatase family protein [Terriglobia bacterium]